MRGQEGVRDRRRGGLGKRDGRRVRGEKFGEKGKERKEKTMHAQRREGGDKGREGGGVKEGGRPTCDPLHPCPSPHL